MSLVKDTYFNPSPHLGVKRFYPYGQFRGVNNDIQMVFYTGKKQKTMKQKACFSNMYEYAFGADYCIYTLTMPAGIHALARRKLYLKHLVEIGLPIESKDMISFKIPCNIPQLKFNMATHLVRHMQEYPEVMVNFIKFAMIGTYLPVALSIASVASGHNFIASKHSAVENAWIFRHICSGKFLDSPIANTVEFTAYAQEVANQSMVYRHKDYCKDFQASLWGRAGEFFTEKTFKHPELPQILELPMKDFIAEYNRIKRSTEKEK